jgi:hypothetical protein
MAKSATTTKTSLMWGDDKVIAAFNHPDLARDGYVIDGAQYTLREVVEVVISGDPETKPAQAGIDAWNAMSDDERLSKIKEYLFEVKGTPIGVDVHAASVKGNEQKEAKSIVDRLARVEAMLGLRNEETEKEG